MGAFSSVCNEEEVRCTLANFVFLGFALEEKNHRGRFGKKIYNLMNFILKYKISNG